MEREQARELGLTENIVGKENVGEARVRHHLRLAELLAGDANGSGLPLHLGKEWKFVRLDMRAQLDPMRIGMRLGVGNVGYGAV